MEDKEFIIKAAEYMGITLSPEWKGGLNYNPLTNGTQLNELIEKMELDITKNHNGTWMAIKWESLGFSGYRESQSSINKDRTTAIVECMKEVLTHE